MRKGSIWVIVCALAIVVVGIVIFRISKSRTFQFFGGLTSRVNTNRKIIALTFDDAPTQYTGEVLRALQEEQVHATFYVIGSALEKYPEKGTEIVQQGHEVGNHSYSHQRFVLKSPSFIKHEIDETNRLIRQTGYTGEITFRPPNGKKLIALPWYLHQQHMKTIMWDVEPDTYGDPTADESARTEFITEYTLDHATAGSIILLHPFCDACGSDRKAIPRIIRALKAKGYSFVTVSDLLKENE